MACCSASQLLLNCSCELGSHDACLQSQAIFGAAWTGSGINDTSSIPLGSTVNFFDICNSILSVLYCSFLSKFLSLGEIFISHASGSKTGVSFLMFNLERRDHIQCS